MFAAMINFSEHPTQPITEIEVFIGFIVNKTGLQTRRQRRQSHTRRHGPPPASVNESRQSRQARAFGSKR